MAGPERGDRLLPDDRRDRVADGERAGGHQDRGQAGPQRAQARGAGDGGGAGARRVARSLAVRDRRESGARASPTRRSDSGRRRDSGRQSVADARRRDSGRPRVHAGAQRGELLAERGDPGGERFDARVRADRRRPAPGTTGRRRPPGAAGPRSRRRTPRRRRARPASQARPRAGPSGRRRRSAASAGRSRARRRGHGPAGGRARGPVRRPRTAPVRRPTSSGSLARPSWPQPCGERVYGAERSAGKACSRRCF